LRIFSFGGYGLALAALALVFFGAIECPHIFYLLRFTSGLLGTGGGRRQPALRPDQPGRRGARYQQGALVGERDVEINLPAAAHGGSRLLQKVYSPRRYPLLAPSMRPWLAPMACAHGFRPRLSPLQACARNHNGIPETHCDKNKERITIHLHNKMS